MDTSAYQHINIRMSTRGKRPLRNLTPSDKVRAIQRIHNGETKASVSRDIGVPESTLRGWCKNEQKLRFMCHQLGVSEQITMDALDNRPEKRTKFQSSVGSQKGACIPQNWEVNYYNHLALNPIEFRTSNAVCTFADNIALNDLGNNQNVGVDQKFGENVDISVLRSQTQSGPFDISQLFTMQNINYSSVLKSGLAFVSGIESTKEKMPLCLFNLKRKPNDNNNLNLEALSVTNWPKDTSKNIPTLDTTEKIGDINGSTTNHIIIQNNYNINNSFYDPYNNNINNNSQENSYISPLSRLEVDNFSQHLTSDVGSVPNWDDTALLDWCKVFNASLNFLSLAAAASSIINPSMSAFQLIKKNKHKINKKLNIMPDFSTLPTTTYSTHSDISNDSNFESEPEDLSVRSIALKASSGAPNSKSQGPTKFTINSLSVNSETEH